MARVGRDGIEINSQSENTAEEIISSVVHSDEKIIWAEHPVSVWCHVKSIWFQYIIYIIFMGIAVFWIVGATSIVVLAHLQEAIKPEDIVLSIAFPFFGIPFLLLGLWKVLAPVLAVKGRWKLVYAITDRRFVIHRRLYPRDSQSWLHSSIGNLQVEGPREGPGNLIFAQVLREDSDQRSYFENIGFIGIADPATLQHLVQREVLKR